MVPKGNFPDLQCWLVHKGCQSLVSFQTKTKAIFEEETEKIDLKLSEFFFKTMDSIPVQILKKRNCIHNWKSIFSKTSWNLFVRISLTFLVTFPLSQIQHNSISGQFWNTHNTNWEH